MNGTASLHKYDLHIYAGKNVARGGQVVQSSTYTETLEGTPDKAIDGNHASIWAQKSCARTLRETNPWWRVDLQKTHIVNSVKITNRKDCCAERINGAEIRVGNDLNDNGNGNPRYALLTCLAGRTLESENDMYLKLTTACSINCINL